MIQAIQEAGAAFPGLDAAWVRSKLALFKSRIEVMRSYRPEVHCGRITLFRASEEDPEEPVGPTDPSLGWEVFASGGVDVHFVPGSHASIGAEPHVTELAARLASCLAAVEESEGSS